MCICLTLTEKNGRVVSWILDKEEVTVGRSSVNDIMPDPNVYTQVSRNHARVRRVAHGRYVFEDIGSTHGSFFHGKRLNSALVLTRGDAIMLGDDGPVLSVDWAQDRVTGREGTHLRQRVKTSQCFPLVFSEGFLGKYDSYEKIGAGGFGEVWRGISTAGRPPIAIKLMHPSLLDPGALTGKDRDSLITRFTREATITHQLALSGAPAIPRVLTWGDDVDRDYLYIVMEMIDGVPLDLRIAQEHPMPVHSVCRIMSDVASALDAAHNFEFTDPSGGLCRGVVHRDVKPNNIVLQYGTDRAWLVDFGIAGIVEGAERLTSTNITVGTHQFLPPENLESNIVTPSTDLWGLTVTLYVTLSGGRFPYPGGDRPQILRSLLKGEVLPIRSFRRELPHALEEAIDRSLQIAPSTRVQSAAEWLRILEPHRRPAS